MIMQDHASFPSEVKGDNNNSLIHNLFVFNKSGVCFYGRNFTDYINVEKNLISPFLTALMTFAKEMIGKPFKTIEMEDIKIVIFEKNSIYYSILCDTFENLTFLDGIVSQINEKLTAYLIKNNINIDAEIIYDSELNETIERNPADGDPFVYHAMSRGEQRTLNLSISRAFAHVMALSWGCIPSFIFLDEVGSNIDEIGKESVYKMILELSQDQQVFVTTHDKQLQNLLKGHSEVHLRRENGFTILSNEN